MNVLLIGSGGREHALAWKLAASPMLTKLYAAPGNPGIARDAECVALDTADHEAVLAFCRAHAIDLVVVNLYPFEATVAKGAERDEIIENIDIGGPSMVRSAAKNHQFVTIVTDPADYDTLVGELEASGATSLDFRRKCAAKAFAATAAYDSMISQWFAFADQQQLFPDFLAVNGRAPVELRYGENPHQKAALYTPAGPHGHGIAQAEQLQGKELSYNNYNDADAALELCAEFAGGEPAVIIVKHANPCGVAQASSLLEAWNEALACDSVSAFGGIVAVNTELDGPTAEAICEIFTEVVIAPSVSEEARAVFARKKNLRLLVTGDLPDPRRGGLLVKPITGGLNVFRRDIRFIGQFTQSSIGGGGSIGFRVGRFSQMFVGYSYEATNVSELNPAFLNPDILRFNPFLADALLLGGLFFFGALSWGTMHTTWAMWLNRKKRRQ